jgi:hypothetical protein
MGDVVPLRPAPTLEAVCADCGQPVEWYPPKDRWASKIAERGNTDAWSFTCRIERLDGFLLAADYHYVDGETQQHFRLRTR